MATPTSADTDLRRRRRITIENIADPATMRKLWTKRIRPGLRQQRFPDFQLGHDPLEYLAFDWELPEIISTLCRDLRVHRYRAGTPEIIRSAKGSGLTRPLAFLQTRDLLVYKAIIGFAESRLLEHMEPWARFGRADTTREDDGDTPASSGWFRDWLKRQGQIWTITEQHQWIVETDIANFFPYVPLASMIDHVLSNSDVGDDVARLLSHMLRQFSPMNEYRQSLVYGLPQENFDCSRVLAHTYLTSLDDEFSPEGEASQYSRYMDDIVIGADTRPQALKQVARVQHALERLGLYPNTSKTRIIKSSYFIEDYMKKENDYLGEVAGRFKSHELEDMNEFKEHILTHVRMGVPKPKAWGRVLRRYYTTSKWVHDDTLLRFAYKHIEEYTDSARHIFEYLTTFQLTVKRHKSLVEMLDRLGGVYEDLDILAHEYVCAAPNLGSDTLRSAVADWAMEVFVSAREHNPRLAAAACLTIGKFGMEAHLEELHKRFVARVRIDDVSRQQALVVLLGASRVTPSELMEIAPESTVESARHIRFLRAITLADPKAVGMALNLIEPKERRDPPRYAVRIRTLFLAPVVKRSAPALRRPLEARWATHLKGNARVYRDFAAERWLEL